MSDAGIEASEPDQGTEGTPEIVEQPQAEALDFDQYHDHMVTVKVGDEDQQVSLEDLRSGYMMQSDYTRKTQELASERDSLSDARALAEALEANPEETARLIWSHYGAAGGETDEQADELTPLEAEVQELRSYVNEQQESAQTAELWGQLEQFYPGDEDAQTDLLRFAVEGDIPNLEWAHAMQVQGRQQAEQAFAAQKASEEDARVEAKRAAGVLEGGSDRASSGSAPVLGDSGNVRSVADAFNRAADSLGL